MIEARNSTTAEARQFAHKHVTSTGLGVAHGIITKWSTAGLAFADWAKNEHRKLAARDEDKEVAWRCFMHVIREVCWELHKAHRHGRRPLAEAVRLLGMSKRLVIDQSGC